MINQLGKTESKIRHGTLNITPHRASELTTDMLQEESCSSYFCLELTSYNQWQSSTLVS